MNNLQVGQFIYRLRKEKGLTQKELGDMLNISNKTVSKWECGLGCPDVSLWSELSTILGADIQKMLEGSLDMNMPDIGKIEKTRFYVCLNCGNILVSTGKASISCCGRRLNYLKYKLCTEYDNIAIEEIETEYYVKINHEMRKEHYILFVAYVHNDRMTLVRLYPEQSPEVGLPIVRSKGSIYIYCTNHGLEKYNCTRK